jgi:hypothetical protein
LDGVNDAPQIRHPRFFTPDLAHGGVSVCLPGVHGFACTALSPCCT